MPRQAFPGDPDVHEESPPRQSGQPFPGDPYLLGWARRVASRRAQSDGWQAAAAGSSEEAAGSKEVAGSSEEALALGFGT